MEEIKEFCSKYAVHIFICLVIYLIYSKFFTQEKGNNISRNKMKESSIDASNGKTRVDYRQK